MARDCHHRWKGLPWLHRALTLVSFRCPTFQTFTICSCMDTHSLSNTHTYAAAPAAKGAWRLYGNRSVMNGRDAETNRLAKQRVLLQSIFERAVGNIIQRVAGEGWFTWETAVDCGATLRRQLFFFSNGGLSTITLKSPQLYFSSVLRCRYSVLFFLCRKRRTKTGC